jgi:hypothetical protein
MVTAGTCLFNRTQATVKHHHATWSAVTPLADDIVANILCSCDSCGLCELARRTWEAFEHVAPELETPA